MRSLIAAVFAAALVVAPAQAADLAAGEELAGQQCAACHGPTGVSQNPEWPTLAGQYADYMEKTLRQYRSGERENAVMQGIAAGLSDEDIRNTSAWYARQEGLKVKRHPR